MPHSLRNRQRTQVVTTCTGLLMLAIAPGAEATGTSTRPSPVAACNAWRVYIGDLIDQHRIASEMTDKDLANIVRQFIAARNACTPGHYELGLRLYEEIPIGPVQKRPLR